MIFYGIGGFCEAYYGAFGWNDLAFRLWYLFGAILVAAWLGQGTVYLLVKSRWANLLMVLLGIGSLYGLVRVFGAELDPALLTSSMHTGPLSSNAIVTPGGTPSDTPFSIFMAHLPWLEGLLIRPGSFGANEFCCTAPLEMFSLR